MKTAILEDNSDRIEWFKENFPDAYITDNPLEFIEFVKNNNPTHLRLDHDLGFFCSDGTEINGTTVAKELAPIISKDTNIIIHSWSSQATKMLWIFQDHGIKSEIRLFEPRKSHI